MRRDPLETLIRIRRTALDAARRELGACLDAEREADVARSHAEAAIAREQRIAEHIEAGDAVVEAFAAWLPDARKRLRQVEAGCERCRGETARARAALSLARGAHEAAEDALARARDEARAEHGRREQLGLDEIASRSRKQ